MLPRGPLTILTLAVLCLAVAAPVFAGFSGTDVFLPAVGAASGVPPSVWYTTVWVHNPGTTRANITVYLLERQANTAPLSYTDTLQPGDTKKYDDAVQLMFAKETFGALRISHERPRPSSLRSGDRTRGARPPPHPGEALLLLRGQLRRRSQP